MLNVEHIDYAPNIASLTSAACLRLSMRKHGDSLRLFAGYELLGNAFFLESL